MLALARGLRLRSVGDGSDLVSALDAFHSLPFVGRWTSGVDALALLTRKDGLLLITAFARSRDTAALARVPDTYVLPAQEAAWCAAQAATPDSAWITKPANSSNGDGIEVLSAGESSAERAGLEAAGLGPFPHAHGSAPEAS